MHLSLIVGCIVSLAYVVMEVFPHKMFDGVPYNRWIETYSMSQIQTIFFLIFPILAAMSMSDMFYCDKKSGYLNYIIAKGEKKHYFRSLYIGNFVVGGLSVLIPLILNLYCCFMLLTNRGPDMPSDAAVNVTFDDPLTIFPHLYYSHPMLHVVMYLLIDFFTGAFFATLALCGSFFIKHRLFVVILPFIFSYLVSSLARHAIALRNFVPEQFTQQLGGVNSLLAVLSFLGIGFLILSLLYRWCVKKKSVL